MTLSDLERRNVMGKIFPVNLCNYARTIWPRTITFGNVWGRIFTGSATSCTPGSPEFCVNHAHMIWQRTTKFGTVTYVGRSILKCQPRPRPQGVPASPNFWDPLPTHIQFGLQQPNLDGNTSGEKRVPRVTHVPKFQRVPYGPIVPKIFGIPTYAHMVCCRAIKSGMVTHVGEERVSRGQPRPHQRSSVTNF